MGETILDGNGTGILARVNENGRLLVSSAVNSGTDGSLDLSLYYTNHEELIFGVTVSGVKFIGRATSEGDWLVVCIRQENNIQITEYATVLNNPQYTSYIDAWTNRATLDCDRIENMIVGDVFVLGTNDDNYIVTNADQFIEVVI